MQPIPYTLGEEIGSGADGRVFEIPNKPNLVCKIGLLYEEENIEKEWLCRRQVLDYLFQNPSPIHVQVYEFGKLEGGVCPKIAQYAETYCIMQRLEPLSNDENKVFHSILSHEDRGIVKNFSTKKLAEILQGLKKGLDFPEQQVMLFIEELKRSPIRHQDLHPRNIMKDDFGNYRLIDLDRCILCE
jgi:serine/threonine protein kinase